MGHVILRSGRRWSLAVLGLALVFSACGSGGSGKGAEAKEAKGGEANSTRGTVVNIANFAFGPKDLQVPAGTKVTWINQDDAPHNIQDTSELKTPISADLKKGDGFSITYSKPGSYPYVCGLHPFMTGTVNVT